MVSATIVRVGFIDKVDLCKDLTVGGVNQAEVKEERISPVGRPRAMAFHDLNKSASSKTHFSKHESKFPFSLV